MKKYFKEFFWHNAVVIAIYIVFAILCNVKPLITMHAFDKLLGGNLHSFLLLMGSNVGLSLVILLMNYSRNVEKAKVTKKMETSLRCDITKRLERCSYSAYNKDNSGTYLSWLDNDVAVVSQSGFSAVYDILDLGAMAVFSFVPLFFIHWSIAAVSAVLSLIVVIVPKFFQGKMTASIMQFALQKQIFISKVKDVLAGFPVLFSFNERKRITEEVKSASIDLAEKDVYQTKKIIMPALVLAFFSMIAGLLILIYTGVLAGYKLVNISAMIAINSFSSTLFSSLSNIASNAMNIKTVPPLLQKFETLEIADDNTKFTAPSFKNKISISDLGFGYEAEKPVLKNLTMEFEIGKKYGIVGESGSGKTTLFKLLTGMLEAYSGSIQYDGLELSQSDKKAVRENIAYIDQNVYIFDDTIKENICLGKDFTEKEIEAAVSQAALSAFVKSQDAELATIAGENGKNFSGGQRQRIGIARAIAHGRKILLIDEGTSALDKENALEIERHLIENPDLTVIMISHHFNDEIREKLNGVYKL